MDESKSAVVNKSLVEESTIKSFWSDKQYKVLNPNLGSGAFGRTLLVEDCDIGFKQVVKVYSPKDLNVDQKRRFFEFFKSEIRILHSLNHPNIVRFFAAHLYAKKYAGLILMEHITGKTLDSYFKEFNPYVDDCNHVFRQLITAFAYLESKKIVHRDIRPSNIMVDDQGVVKVLDFGFGKDLATGSITNSIQTVVNLDGITNYPGEYYDGEYTSQTDMYYLGELLSHLMVKQDIQDVFFYSSIVEKMKQVSPEGRYGSFAEILQVMEEGDFESVEISGKEKVVYRNFVSPVVAAFSNRASDSVINKMDESLILKLENILKDNAFEECIQDKESFLKVFVCGEFQYYSNSQITTECVREFCRLYKLAPENKRELMVRNFNTRIKLVPIAKEEELPF